jgi:hypothetical protein
MGGNVVLHIGHTKCVFNQSVRHAEWNECGYAHLVYTYLTISCPFT